MTLDEALHVSKQLSPMPQVAHEAMQVLVAELARHEQRARQQLVQTDHDARIGADVQSVIDNPGCYVLGDANAPGVCIPIVSTCGRIYSVNLDAELNPARFFESVTFNGPFLAKVVPSGYAHVPRFARAL